LAVKAVASRVDDGRRKISLQAFREQAIEAQSQLASIYLEMPNGEEFEIPHPMLISDDAQQRLEIVQLGEDLDKDKDGDFIDPPTINGKRAEPMSIRTARALLGADEHARFVAAGGHSNDVTLAWQMVVKEQKELNARDPK
jgi:hypothetical protein